MSNQKTLPYTMFKSRIREQGPRKHRCVPVQNAIFDLEVIQIFLQWAGQNPYLMGTVIKL